MTDRHQSPGGEEGGLAVMEYTVYPLVEDNYTHGYWVGDFPFLPLSSFIILVWESFCSRLGLPAGTTSVQFRDVRVHDVLPLEGCGTELLVGIQTGSGRFQVSSAEVSLVSGTIRAVEGDTVSPLPEPEEGLDSMASETFYRMLAVRGLHYRGRYRPIESSSGRRAALSSAEWELVVEAALQMAVTGGEQLQEVDHIHFITIDLSHHSGHHPELVYHPDYRLFRCGGIQVRDVHVKKSSIERYLKFRVKSISDKMRLEGVLNPVRRGVHSNLEEGTPVTGEVSFPDERRRRISEREYYTQGQRQYLRDDDGCTCLLSDIKEYIEGGIYESVISSQPPVTRRQAGPADRQDALQNQGCPGARLEDGCYVVVCARKNLGLEIVDRLISLGANKITINTPEPRMEYLKIKLKAWRSEGVTVRVCSENPGSMAGALTLLSRGSEVAPVRGLFLLCPPPLVAGNHFRESQVAVHKLDTATKRICQQMKYFIVFTEIPKSVSTKSSFDHIFDSRLLDNLPMLEIRCLDSSGTCEVKDERVLIEVLTRSLCLGIRDLGTVLEHQLAVITYSHPTLGEQIDDDTIQHIMGDEHLNKDDDLEHFGVDLRKANLIRDILKIKRGVNFTEKSILNMTYKELRGLLKTSVSAPTSSTEVITGANGDQLASDSGKDVFGTVRIEDIVLRGDGRDGSTIS